MPKPTFFNLPQEKQEKLLGAIRAELSRVPVAELSINKIVKEAEISRGSFYQYFRDRADMLEYVMSEFRRQMLKKISQRLSANNGDIFDIAFFVLECSLAMADEAENSAIFENVLSDIKVNSEFYLKISNKKKQLDDEKELSPLIDKKRFGLDKQEFSDLLHLLKILCGTTLADVFMHPENRGIIIEDYKRRIKFLKEAIERNNNA